MAVGTERTTRADIDTLLRERETLDDRAFETIVRHYRPSLVRYATRRGAADPEAVANDVLLSGYEMLPHLRKRREQSLRAFLFLAASRRVIDGARATTFETIDIDDLAADPAGEFESESVDAMWLRELVDELSPDQRETIQHRFFDDLTADQAADLQGREANAIYQLQHRAVARLRRLAFAGTVTLVVAIAVAIIWSRSGGDTVLDNTPVDSPVQPAPDGEADADEQSAPQAPQDQADDTTLNVESDADSATTQRITPASEPGTAPVTSTPTEDGAAAESDDTTTTTPSTITVTDDAIVTFINWTFNACSTHQLNGGLSALRLYDPQSNAQRADAFTPPVAIRFLDATGTPISTIDLSKGALRGTEAGSFGWIGQADASGTYATYSEAPVPARWGVLIDASVADSWALVEVQAPTPVAVDDWSPVGSCTPRP